MRFVLLLALAGFAFQAELNPTYVHIGYSSGKAIFREIHSNKVFQLDDVDRLSELHISNENEIIKYINDCSLVFGDKHRVVVKKKDNYILGIFESKSEIKNIKVAISDCNFLVYESSDSLHIFKRGVLVGKIKGTSPQVAGEWIYFNSYDAKVDAFVDLYKCNVNSITKRELVLQNIYEQGILVFDEGKFIAHEAPIKGMPTKFIFNTVSKKFVNIKSSLIPRGVDYPIFFPSTKSLRYYRAKNLILSKDIVYD